MEVEERFDGDEVIVLDNKEQGEPRGRCLGRSHVCTDNNRAFFYTLSLSPFAMIEPDLIWTLGAPWTHPGRALDSVKLSLVFVRRAGDREDAAACISHVHKSMPVHRPAPPRNLDGITTAGQHRMSPSH